MKRILALFVLAVVLTAAGCSSTDGPASAWAANVNGTKIAMSTLYDDLALLAENESYKNGLQQQGIEVFGEDERTYTTAFVASWLTTLIQNEVVSQQLASLGGAPTAQEQSQAEDTYSQLASSGELPQSFIDRLVAANADQLALQRVLQESAPPNVVTDEQVRAYYDENIEQTMQQAGGDVACVTHVSALFDATGQAATPTPQQEAAAQEGIDQVTARLDSGEDLRAIADELSATPGAAVTGGNLGCFAEQGGTLPTQLVDAAFQQPVGEAGAVVRTDLGFHIVLVRSRGVFPFEEAEEAIRQQLEQQTGSAVQAEATRFLNESTIEVDPRFGTFDTATAAVVPPEGPTPPPTTGLPDPLANLPGRVGADEPGERGTP